VVVDQTTRFDSAPYPELFGRAVQLRADREAFQDRVESGAVHLDEVFAAGDADPAISGMKVLGLIEGLPEFFKVQTRRAFGDLGISEAAHVRDVTAEQRAGLPAALARHQR